MSRFNAFLNEILIAYLIREIKLTHYKFEKINEYALVGPIPSYLEKNKIIYFIERLVKTHAESRLGFLASITRKRLGSILARIKKWNKNYATPKITLGHEQP